MPEENQPVPVPLTQVQPMVPPPGSAVPTSEPTQPAEPAQEQETPEQTEGQEPEPVESPEETIPPPKSKTVAPKKKLKAVKKKEVKQVAATYPFKAKKAKSPRRVGAAVKRHRGPSLAHHKPRRSSMSHHGFKGGY